MPRTLLLAALAAVAMTDDALAQAKRPMQVDDLFKFKRVADPQISPDGQWVVYQVTEITDPAQNKKHTHLWIVKTDGTSAPRQLTSSGKSDTHPRWSPDGAKILFESTRGGTPQLYVIDLKTGGEAAKLTSISTGAGTALWSPDGSKIAFVSAVHPEFSTLPFAESDKKNAEKDKAAEESPVKAKTFTKLFYRHWDSYVEDKRQHLFVINADGSDCRDVTPGDRDAYPTSTTFSVGDDFTFSPDSKHLVFTAVPAKEQAWSTNHDLCRVSITNTSKDWETLTKSNPAADTAPKFSPDGTKLAWRAQKKAGYEADKWDILIADAKPDGTISGTPRNVTSQSDISIDEFVWAPGGGIVVSYDSEGAKKVLLIDHPTQRAAGVFGRSYTSLSVGGTAKKTIIAFAAASMTAPAEVAGMEMSENGNTFSNKEVVFANPNSDLLAQLDLNRPESVKVPVEGAEMQMWILKPPGFDASKKYPVAYLVHGGPQGAWENGWSFRWNAQTWAAQGYVVVMPNPRGSTGFGQKFCDEICGDWGGKCYRDLVSGVNAVKKLPYIDPNRMASAGGSFGGYMQNWFAVSEIAKEFKCLITHCSVYNFESMWGTTDELWFDEWEHQGLPWEKPGSYAEFSPHKIAGNMGKYKVPMLIIHNDLDFRCPIGQGHELFSALQRQNIPSRFVNFPDEGHWVLKPANSKRWHEEVFGWLNKHCKEGK